MRRPTSPLYEPSAMNAETPLFSDARAAADRPLPKPGILDITPYKPGKATAEGIAHPVKLSGNENILGCSPKAREAYLAAVGELNVYPDGRGGALRDVDRRALPDRAGAARAGLRHRRDPAPDQPGLPGAGRQHRAGPVRVRRLRHRRARLPGRGAQRRRAQLSHRRREDAGAGRRAHAAGVHHQPGQPHRHLHHQGGADAPARRAAAAAWCWWSTPPTPSSAPSPPSPTGWRWRARRPTSSSPTPSPSCMAWRRCASAGRSRRRRSPTPSTASARRSTSRSRASPRRWRRWPTSSSRRVSRDHVLRWRPWLTQQLGGLGLNVTPSGANFVLVEFPHDPRQDRGRGGSLPRLAGPDRARRRQLRPARPPAHHHRPRRAQPRPRRRAG